MPQMRILDTVTIKGELTDLNTYIDEERGNKFGAAKIKKRETFKCQLHFKKADIKGRIRVNYHWYSKNLRKDPDNISFAKKFILDGMVNSGFIKNDGQKQIAGFSDTFFVDKENPRVEIFITEHS